MVLRARANTADADDCVAVNSTALQEIQFAQATAMTEKLQKYVKLLADAFNLSPTCKVMKELNKDEDEDDSEDSGNPPDGAVQATAQPAVQIIESDQEQDSQSSHGNEGSTGSAPKDNTVADEEI